MSKENYKNLKNLVETKNDSIESKNNNWQILAETKNNLWKLQDDIKFSFLLEETNYNKWLTYIFENYLNNENIS